MMGTKVREFTTHTDISVEALVPSANCYRHLERTLDLAFVRDLVREHYAAGGRPGSDPVVFFTLQLILFFEGLRSERQLMSVVADRLSLRWYLGYDLDEAVVLATVAIRPAFLAIPGDECQEYAAVGAGSQDR